MAMFSQRDWRDELSDDVLHHLSRLRREVLALSGDAGRSLQHGAHDLGGALAATGGVLARRLTREARRAGKAVQRDPVPALAGAIALACLASLMMGKKR